MSWKDVVIVIGCLLLMFVMAMTLIWVMGSNDSPMWSAHKSACIDYCKNNNFKYFCYKTSDIGSDIPNRHIKCFCEDVDGELHDKLVKVLR